MTALIAYFLLAIAFSFLCSLVEAVILSTTPAYVAVLVKDGARSGPLLLKLKERIDQSLSAILTVNTVAHTVGAAGVGAEALRIFGSRWMALTSVVLTLAILVFSEIIPKTLGAAHWRKLAPLAAIIIQGLIIITYPLVVSFEVLSRLLSPAKQPSAITRDELLVSSEMTKAGGDVLDRERKVIRNLLHLNNILVKDILTPRSVLFALPRSETVGNVIHQYSPIRFSRIPIFGENLDDITGIVHRFRLSQEFNKGHGDKTLAELGIHVHIVPESKTVADCLFEFIQRGEHIFLVVDEYGGTAGIITLEDTIETLLGVEIVDELDSVADMRAYARQLWEKKQQDRKIE